MGRVAAGAVAKKLLPAAGVKGAKKAKVPGYDGQLGPLDEGTLPKCYLIWA
ncbi:MAG: hypothetical protein NTX42_09800 [Methanothrix sp.]|nr:hypothetical protein [Methanothrix sp.]